MPHGSIGVAAQLRAHGGEPRSRACRLTSCSRRRASRAASAAVAVERVTLDLVRGAVHA
jgi:hypothetical protein